ncbi:small conductance calcium-activated potassium channel protein-like [Lineus longissimus]|uniref:small conductance calcium-activated potassium channel protein-like n=1 Tax=Lineus longissimus TaxID=88925 RepID=UPI00315CD96A
MSTLIEDPGIPLVNSNGGFPKYTEGSMDEEDPDKPRKMEKRGLRFEHVGHRLAKRKELFCKRRIICDFALAFALFGIGLMVIETEMYANKVYGKEDLPSLMMKSFISISTVILLGFIVWYHWLDIQLFMIDNGMEDWKLALTTARCFKITLELLICAIHPIPGDFEFSWTTMNFYSKRVRTVQIPIDVIFSLPMFLRLYMVCRAIMLHSKLYTDASSQSLGALNRINFNFRFIFKSYMTLYPEYVLTVIIVSLFLLASWALRACEMYHDKVHANFFNSMWMIAITFLSVGYGDIVPNSYCGRGIAVMTGIFGAGCTALIVAVLARKLELSRAEKYVHNFVIDVELDKKQKHAAANILKQGWLIYKCKKRGKKGETQLRKHQRRLLKAIHSIREVKTEQRRLMDNTVNIVEMNRTQSSMHYDIGKISQKQDEVDERLGEMESTLKGMDTKISELHKMLMSRMQQR